MKKLSIFSAILYWSVFWVSLYLVLSYILDAHRIRDFFSGGWFGHIWFAFTIVIVNITARFFPVYYLLLVSYLRKIQKDNEKDYRAGKGEPYFYDISTFFYKIKQRFNNHVDKDVKSFISDYKDTIREERREDKLKLGATLEQATESNRNSDQTIKNKYFENI